MKSISASIVVFSGAMMIVGGAFIRHSQTQGVVLLLGGCVGFVGLCAWLVSLREK